jgi:hypothetical protein
MRHTVMAVALLGALVSCKSSTRGPGGGRDSGLNFGEDDMAQSMMSTDDAMMMSTQPLADLAGIEAATYPIDLSIDRDASGCAPGQTGISCAMPVADNAGCGPPGYEICGDGLDNDCNGKVDDGCPCHPGDVQRCFLGPPGKRGVGGCTDGTQTCIGSSEFGGWDDCIGSIGPQSEVCDGLDNDCNGCADDQLCCGGGGILCPAPNDPRIAPVAPFQTKMYTGSQFFVGNAVTWTWTVEGGPCDKLFASADFTPQMMPPPQSFKLMGGNTANPSIYFSLSGDYTVTLTVVDDKGRTYTCKWVQRVVAPGVRFELCWDHQGTGAQGGGDLDLHVHRSGTTTGWFTAPGTVNIGKCKGASNMCNRGATCISGNCILPVVNGDDCHYPNCTALAHFTTNPPNPYAPTPAANWTYTNSTPDTNCTGSKYGTNWDTLMYCANPRLDLDNVTDIGAPENTNIDNPNNADSFRAMVHYYGQDFGTSSASVTEHPIVNVYCGGTLKATYGQKPNQIAGFTTGSGYAKGQIWRVADVKAQVAAGVTVGCTVTPLHPKGTTAGYDVVTDPNNTNMAYDPQ